MAAKPEYYLVRNWSNFQHYKDRDPPWIKLHFSILSSEDWVTLDDASRVLAIACMLIASRNQGQVPNRPDYIRRVAYLSKDPNFTPLIKCGFLSNPLADASIPERVQADATTEAEQIRSEAETDKNFGRSSYLEFYDVFPKKKDPRLAEKAFFAAVKRGADPLTIISGAQCYAKERAGQEPRFTKAPAAWLNADAWLNEPEPNGKDDLNGRTLARITPARPSTRNGFAEFIASKIVVSGSE